MLVYQRVVFNQIEHVMQAIPWRFQLEIACIPRVTQGFPRPTMLVYRREFSGGF